MLITKKGDKNMDTKVVLPISQTRKELAVKKTYSALEITNAVEKVLLDHGYSAVDSYETNNFLMNVLENLGHYNNNEGDK